MSRQCDGSSQHPHHRSAHFAPAYRHRFRARRSQLDAAQSARAERSLRVLQGHSGLPRQGRQARRAARLRPHDPEPAEERNHRQLPGADGQRRVPALQGLPHPAQQHPRPVQGRHALPRDRRARRLQGARGDDDLEVRAHEPAVRRRQGRHQVQPAHRLARRARAHHAPLLPRARRATSAPTTTSPRPTWAPTRRSWPGRWTRT